MKKPNENEILKTYTPKETRRWVRNTKYYVIKGRNSIYEEQEQDQKNNGEWRYFFSQHKRYASTQQAVLALEIYKRTGRFPTKKELS